MAVVWTIYDSFGAPLSVQPSGETLQLEFTENGFTHLSGQSALIDRAEAVGGTSTVTMELRPDEKAVSEGVTLAQDQTDVDPTTNVTWTGGSNGLVTLVFNVPPIGGPNSYDWTFSGRPTIALRIKAKVRR